jgi:hypothetical protein
MPCFHLPMENTEVAVYREFVRQTRERAEATRYPEIKRALLKIAREYERWPTMWSGWGRKPESHVPRD